MVCYLEWALSFDGYNFKNYKSNMEDLGGLTNDRLLDIVEDKFGCIWVLCYDSTCYRFNPDKEVFEPVIQKQSITFGQYLSFRME